MSIEKAYDSWAAQYDTNENKTRDLDQKATIETLKELNFNRVIELGCGTGKNTEWLINFADEIISLDFSASMLTIAKEKVNSPKVRFIKTDLNQQWEVPNKFADLVTASLTLEHIKNLDAIFKQVALKLKKNGYFFICELHPIKQYLGSKAQFETEGGIQDLEVFLHHTSEFIDTAQKNGFKLIKLNEWFDKDTFIPRLISFVFKK